MDCSSILRPGRLRLFLLQVHGENHLTAIQSIQAKPVPQDLAKLSEALGVSSQSLTDSLGDHWWPTRGLGPDPPTDPVIYRLHEVSSLG